jgi:hypothetical protein
MNQTSTTSVRHPRLAFGVFSAKFRGMSYRGTVKDGVVVLAPGVELPDGTEVAVVPCSGADDDPLLAAVRKVSKPRPHWPKDYALNHGHYVSGEPRKS